MSRAVMTLERVSELNDSDYVRLLDSLGRFYDSQATAHAGYFLTSVVAYFALFSLALVSKWISLLLSWTANVELASLVLFICLGLLYCVSPMPLSPIYLWARREYWSALSWEIKEHLGLSDPNTTRFQAIKERALRIGIQRAVVTMFEARLYRSCVKEEGKSEDLSWRQIFDFEGFLNKGFDMSLYRRPKTDVLLVAMRPIFETDDKSEKAVNIAKLFDPYRPNRYSELLCLLARMLEKVCKNLGLTRVSLGV
jgi:hypothetical protein